jgi:hypothetical protein
MVVPLLKTLLLVYIAVWHAKIVDMNKIEILADEKLIIRDGGEIPEVTLHSSIFYLTKDPNGPNISLTEDDINSLKTAVIFCYHRIIIRDLSLENRDKGLYRGLERCRLNWQRLVKFCLSEQLDFGREKGDINRELKKFMANEVKEVKQGLRRSSVNCSKQALQEFCKQLDLDSADLPENWQDVCK